MKKKQSEEKVRKLVHEEIKNLHKLLDALNLSNESYDRNNDLSLYVLEQVGGAMRCSVTLTVAFGLILKHLNLELVVTGGEPVLVEKEDI